MIATQCDAYVMHGDPVAAIAPKIADMTRRREEAGLDLLLLQMSPQAEEMDRFAEQVIAPMRARQPELVPAK